MHLKNPEERAQSFTFSKNQDKVAVLSDMNGLYVYSLTDLNKSLRQVDSNNLEAQKKENLQNEESKGTVHTKEFHFKESIVT